MFIKQFFLDLKIKLNYFLWKFKGKPFPYKHDIKKYNYSCQNEIC